MTPEDVKNIVRLEMRALADEIHNIYTGNHDADEATKAISRAIYRRFPLTLREECEQISEGYPTLYARSGYYLDDVGTRIGAKRIDRESDADYRARLQSRVAAVLAGIPEPRP